MSEGILDDRNTQKNPLEEVRLTQWFQYVYGTPNKMIAAWPGPDSNFTIAIALYFKPSFGEGPIFTTLY